MNKNFSTRMKKIYIAKTIKKKVVDEQHIFII
jgi:hypothetical protein